MIKLDWLIILILVVTATALFGWYFSGQFWSAAGRDLPPPISGSGNYQDMIRVTTPRPGAVVNSPLLISGEARGGWYFEADFPVILVDWDGRIIAESYATAEGEWMTENYVPFRAVLRFTSPFTTGMAEEPFRRGALILQKDNPSGLPEHDAAIEIPILFK